MRVVALILIALALPFAAACGGDDGTDTADEAGNGAGQTIQVTATDFAFDPADLSADAGQIVFELTNDGESPHALRIEGDGLEEESDTIEGGETTELTVELDEGTYEVYCPVGDHADRGMVGTLTVGGGAAGGAATTDDDGETQTGETETDDDDSGAGGY